MFSKVKSFLSDYNVSVTIVGTAVVLSTLFGECSYDYETKEVDVSTSVETIVEGVKESKAEQ
jgi:ribosomal protein L7Ae-like RNA K-turn-binding protein